jgi:hypothetical protein
LITPFRIDDLPLYWRTTATANAERPAGIPARADFEFTFDAGLGLIRQRVTPELADTLERVYRAEANVGYLQVGQSLADPYGQDLWRFIDKAFAMKGRPKTALEIGCGGCYILDLLTRAGVDAMGIDPSPIAVRTAAAMGFKVVEGFFPHPAAAGPFGLILHIDVLEHVADPVGFLRSQRDRLTDEGLLIISIPDCTSSNAAGDLSMIIHQHINFFDVDSLAVTCRAAGLEPLLIERSNYGGSLYCLAQHSEPSLSQNSSAALGVYERFCSQAAAVAERFARILKDALAQGRTVGCYVPLRAFPYLALAGHLESVRLFDDSAEMAHRFFDGVSRRVENFEDLQADPPDLVFVMSYSFGERIRDKIQNRLGTRSRIITLADLAHG